MHRTYVGRLERGESGVTVDSLAAILAALDVSLNEFFKPFKDVVRPRTPRRRDQALSTQWELHRVATHRAEQPATGCTARHPTPWSPRSNPHSRRQ